MRKSVKFSPEVQERAVRMVVEAQGQHESQWSSRQLRGTSACQEAGRRHRPVLRPRSTSLLRRVPRILASLTVD